MPVISLVMSALMVIVTLLYFAAPSELSDNNRFLQDFISKDYISFLGIFSSISIAASATLYIELNRFEESVGREVFPKTKRSLKRSAFIMAWLFTASIFLIFGKHAPILEQRFSITFNYISIMLCLMAAWQLLDIVKSMFMLPARLKK